MSNVLRVSYSVENEAAQNAIHDFAAILQKALTQYQKLWIQHIELIEKFQDPDVKYTLQNLTHHFAQEQENVNTSEGKTKGSVDFKENNEQVSYNVLSQNNSGKANTNKTTYTRDDRDSAKSGTSTCYGTPKNKENVQVLTELSSGEIVSSAAAAKSPILYRKRIKANIKRTLFSSPHKDISVAENRKRQKSATPEKKQKKRFVATPSKSTCDAKHNISISSLYNVHTTLLSTGKKLRQSKLIFNPITNIEPVSLEENNVAKKKTHKIVRTHHYPLKTNEYFSTSFVPENRASSNNNVLNVSQHVTLCDDVIEMSPPLQSKLHFDYVKRTKLNAHQSEHNQTSVSEKNSMHITQKECKVSASSVATDKIETKADPHKPESQSQQKMLKPMSCFMDSTCDETFFSGGQTQPKLDDVNPLQISNFEDDIFMDHSSMDRTPTKKILDKHNETSEKCKMDTVHNSVNNPAKYKSYRTNLNGQDCWECEQYYKNLGLSETELRQRKNQCSRHRTKYNEIQNTPDGFWDPVFPDMTFMSPDI